MIICTKCEANKDESDFNKGCNNGYHRWCRQCQKKYKTIWDKNNSKAIATYGVEYNKANKQIIAEKNANWRENNPEYGTEYRKTNAKHIKERNAKYYKTNREAISEYGKEWSRKNPHKRALHHADRAFMLKRATPSWFKDEEHLVDKIYLKRNELNRTLGRELSIKYTVDHIIPINPKDKSVCGLHCWFNLQILDGELNCEKLDCYQQDW